MNEAFFDYFASIYWLSSTVLDSGGIVVNKIAPILNLAGFMYQWR